jgi:hypothetical protein
MLIKLFSQRSWAIGKRRKRIRYCTRSPTRTRAMQATTMSRDPYRKPAGIVGLERAFGQE